MKYFIKIILIFVISISVQAKEFNFGLNVDRFVQIAQADSKIALALWIKELSEKENVLMNVKYYENDNIIMDEYLNDNLDIMVNSFVNFHQNEKKILKNSLFLWTISTNEKNKMFSYCILVNKKSGINSIKDIKNKKLIIKHNDYLANIWLDKLSYETNNKSYLDLIKTKTNHEKISSMILSVFFGESDFTIVPKYSWENMIELNPGIKKDITVFIESEPIFVPIVGAVNGKNIDKDFFLRLFLSTASRAENSARTQQIRELIRYQKIFILEPNDLNKLKFFYEEYLRLKKV